MYRVLFHRYLGNMYGSIDGHIWNMSISVSCVECTGYFFTDTLEICAGVQTGIYGICPSVSPVLNVQGIFHRYLGIMCRSTDRHILNMSSSVSCIECSGYFSKLPQKYVQEY